VHDAALADGRESIRPYGVDAEPLRDACNVWERSVDAAMGGEGDDRVHTVPDEERGPSQHAIEIP